MQRQLHGLVTVLALSSFTWVWKDTGLYLGPSDDWPGMGSHRVWTSANVMTGVYRMRWEKPIQNAGTLGSACVLRRVGRQASLWHQSCMGGVGWFTFRILHALVNSHRQIVSTDTCSGFCTWGYMFCLFKNRLFTNFMPEFVYEHSLKIYVTTS